MATTQPAQAPASRGIQPLDSLHRHARLVVFLFPLIVIAGLPLVFIQGQPTYQTTATFQVSPRYMKTLRDDIELEFQSNTQFLQFIQQQARTVNRFDILENALHKLDREGHDYWRRQGESERRRIERLQQSLAIRHVRDTYLVQVTLTAGKPDGLAEVVNAVIAAYLEQARIEQVFAADERVASLHQREQELLARIESMTAERSAISQILGVTAFNPDEPNPFDRQLRQLQEALTEARQRRIVAEARMEAFLEQQESDTDMRSIQETILTDPGLNSLKASLNQRRALLLSSTAGLAPNHPARLDAEDELAAIETEIQAREQALRTQLLEGMQRRHQTSAQQMRRIESNMEDGLSELRERSGHYAENFNQAVSLNKHLDLLWRELDRVRDRLNFFAAEEASPGFSRLVTPALPPLYPTGTGKKRLLMMLLIAAAGVSLTVPLVVDFLDPRIRSAADAHRAVGFAPMAWLVNADSADRRRFLDDQLRRLASSLIREHERNTTRVLVITSTRPGGGTSWLVRKVAENLNQLGYPALSVDANASGSNTAAGPGLAQWLTDQVETAPIMTEGSIDRIGSGLGRGEPGLPMLERLAKRLRGLHEPYRFILIDAPPLLTHADAELVAGAADAVLLIAEAEAVHRGELQRATRLLQAIDPPVVGVIVNRIRPFLGGGYIGSLIEEHRRGQKLSSDNKLTAVKVTMLALARAPFDILDEIVGRLRRSRRA